MSCPWFALAVTFPRHPKVLRAGELPAWLYVCGLAYCQEHLTDGLIPAEALAGLSADAEARAEVLVREGLWERCAEGYRVPAYLDWQQPRAVVLARRKADAERKREARARKTMGRKPEAQPAAATGAAADAAGQGAWEAGQAPEGATRAAGELASPPAAPGGSLTVESFLATLEREAGRRFSRGPKARGALAQGGVPPYLHSALAHHLRDYSVTPTQAEHLGRWLARGGWRFLPVVTVRSLTERPGLHDALTQALAWDGRSAIDGSGLDIDDQYGDAIERLAKERL